MTGRGHAIVPGQARGRVIVFPEGLSFWGGVDPATGVVIDAHHPMHGTGLGGQIVVMPTSRGSCTGSGVLLELAQSGNAPAALIFREDEDILTLGALVAVRMFGVTVPVIRLDAEAYATLAACDHAEIGPDGIEAGDRSIPLAPLDEDRVALTPRDRAMLAGETGQAAQVAMSAIVTMAAAQGARALTDVTRAHIDGCIYASPANLRFAERMADLGAQVAVPTTMNAISVDHARWRDQGVPPSFGTPAQALADAYVSMGARPSFTCAPYLLDDPPEPDEAIGWSESNAVIYANSALGARTVKHPDFLDLFIALTGRAPLSGVYLDENRRPARVIEVDLPPGCDDALWPLIGWLAGRLSPDRIPLLTGLEATGPGPDDLKALCAAFGTTSAAPMLHVAGITPEAGLPAAPGAETLTITRADLLDAWTTLNTAPRDVDLVAFGSPHFSLEECRRLDALLAGRRRAPGTEVIVTLGRDVAAHVEAEGIAARLASAGVQVIRDLCWCSISEPVFPPGTRVLMTNSGKYAHYGPGLSGREVRFGSLADCVEAAVTGQAPADPPGWLG